MGLAAKVAELSGPLPKVRFAWDAETEILSGHLVGVDASKGLTGSVELEGKDGSFVVLDIADGVMRGLEIVVWPRTQTVTRLTPPAAAAAGRLLLDARASQPGIAAVEMETTLLIERSEDESMMHIRVGNKRKITATQLGDGLILEVDRRGQIAGFWLMGVPRFEVPEEQ
ncbi:MAG TPA: hypothetical protein VD793_00210 [Gemmatimonadales bacterium]|nr:hypothetical protein [Gemmatimonadales bacterium]